MKTANSLFRYLLPFFVFLFFSFLQGRAETAQYFWSFYALKTISVSALYLLLFHKHWNEIKGRFDIRAVALGLVVLAVWITGCKIFYNNSQMAFDPMRLQLPAIIYLAIAIKFIGSAIVVPFMEEIVFRSFFMRYIISEDFLSVPLGSYTLCSFWVSNIIFALCHAEWQWGMALFTGISYSLYLVKTKNLFGCILAHGVTNFGLAVYVILTKNWWLWI